MESFPQSRHASTGADQPTRKGWHQASPLGLVASLLSHAHRHDSLDAARRLGRAVELAPGSSSEASVAVALPDEFARVVRTHPESTFELEHQRLAPGRHDHPATSAYVVEDAMVYRGDVVRIGGHHVGPRGKRLRSLRAEARQFDAAMLCTDHVIQRYFGHWMHDGLPLEVLAHQQGLPALVGPDENWLRGDNYDGRLSGDYDGR